MIKTAGWRKLPHFFERTKETVPQRNIGKVVPMDAAGVVEGVMFWALEEPANPHWRADVHVIEEFADDREDVVPGRRLDGSTKEDEDDGADKDRIRNHFNGMFVE